MWSQRMPYVSVKKHLKNLSNFCASLKLDSWFGMFGIRNSTVGAIKKKHGPIYLLHAHEHWMLPHPNWKWESWTKPQMTSDECSCHLGMWVWTGRMTQVFSSFWLSLRSKPIQGQTLTLWKSTHSSHWDAGEPFACVWGANWALDCLVCLHEKGVW